MGEIIINIVSYLLIGLGIWDSFKMFRKDSGLIKRVYFNDLRDWLWAFLMMLGVVTVIILLSLIHLPQFLRFSWISLISSEVKSQNLITSPALSGSIPIVCIFWVVFTLCLPYLAKIEEIGFRGDVTDIKSRIIKSIAFGLVHMIMGIQLYIAIILIFVGYLFSCKYMVGFRRGGNEVGLAASTSLHAKYNFIIITFGCLVALLSLLYK
jgi:membrane protease YdiL (CAAX protease family)